MMAAVLVENPAGRRRRDLRKLSGRVNHGRRRNRPFLQTRDGRNRLKGRTGSQVFLGHTVNEGGRQILPQAIVIIGIHHIGQPVVIVAGIGHTGQGLAGIRIHDYDAAAAGLQRKLRRGNLQISDLVQHKAVGAKSAGFQL